MPPGCYPDKCVAKRLEGMLKTNFFQRLAGMTRKIDYQTALRLAEKHSTLKPEDLISKIEEDLGRLLSRGERSLVESAYPYDRRWWTYAPLFEKKGGRLSDAPFNIKALKLNFEPKKSTGRNSLQR